MTTYVEGEPSRPSIMAMDEVQPREVSWLWEGVLALGRLTLLTGAVGVGKSLVALDIAARLSRGGTFPGDLAPCPAGGTLLINADDDLGDTVRPRLEAAGADLLRVFTCRTLEHGGADSDDPAGPESLDLRRDWEGLAGAIDRVPDCKLVVIDPISALFTYGRDKNSAKACGVLGRLADLALQSRLAILAVARVSKSADDLLRRADRDDPGYLAAARGAWSIFRDRRSEARLMLSVQQTFREGCLAFRICPDAARRPRVEWCDRSAPRLVEGVAGGAGVPASAGCGNRLKPELQREQQSAVPLLGVRKRAAPLTAAAQQQQLLAQIHANGGRITARELMRSSSKYKTCRQAKTALGQLVAAGVVIARRLPPGRQGGRPLKLYEAVAVDAV